MGLEDRVQQLEDRAAINELVVRYFLAADGDDLETVGSSFTDDATFSSSGALSASGRQGIVEFIRNARTHMGLTVHTPHYAQVSFTDRNHATGLIGAHLELVLGGEAIYGAVRYVDSYVRDAGIWRITRRDMRTIYMAPWLDVGRAMSSDMPVRWPGAPAGISDYPRATVTL